jgi:hypothetical protein
MDPINNPQKPLEAKGGSPDPETLKRVKELFLLFAHAISATKLFPAHHASVINFQEELYDKLTKFFGRTRGAQYRHPRKRLYV